MSNFDMLVKLYDLPDYYSPSKHLQKDNIRIIHPMPADYQGLLDFVSTHFGENWRSECEKSLMCSPPTCFIAVKDKHELIAFSCYDATMKNFFGPIGVQPTYQQSRIGGDLLLACLHEMKQRGYGYAIIGWANDQVANFYTKVANATRIANSFPGVYNNCLDLKE